MSYAGMDPEQVEQLGHRINTEASNLQSVVSKLDTLVGSMAANWDGADSTRFHDAYQNQYRTQMNNAVQQLQQLSQVAISNAGDQRTTSS